MGLRVGTGLGSGIASYFKLLHVSVASSGVCLGLLI